MSKSAIARLKSQFGDKILSTSDFRGDDSCYVAPGDWVAVATFLRDDAQLKMNMFTDLTAVDYPERERELAIVRAQVPEASEALAQQVALFVSRLRSQPFADAFQRAPGIAESVEWAKALVALDTLVVDPEVVSDTAGILFKQREDVAALTAALASELLQPEPEAS